MSERLRPRDVALWFYTVQAGLCAAAVWVSATGELAALAASIAGVLVIAVVLSVLAAMGRRAVASAQVGGDGAEAQGRRKGFGPRVGAELTHDALHVGLQGVGRDG